MSKKLYLEDLDKQQLTVFYNELHSNSHDLLEVSRQAYVNNKYGIAISLAITSTEELTKGIIVYLFSKGVQLLQINDIRKAFYNHSRKHEFASIFELFKILDLDPKDAPPIKKTGVKLLDTLGHWVNMGKYYIDALSGMSERLDWWLDAEKNRLRGFYVDYREESMTSPSQIKKEEVDFAFETINQLTERFEAIKNGI
ncbi:MAG: AbiV family abortive infection protein [Ekhidna sp.]|nr:AbiV family abortive infection protein [Ekhidna sp.]